MIPVKGIVDALAGQTFPNGPLVAALPMYDWPERRAEVDAEWVELRDALRSAGMAAPHELARRNADLRAVPGGIRDDSGKIIAPDPATLPPDEFDLAVLWQHPGLLFAQTCWGPLKLWLGGRVRIVGQDDYSGIEGGEGEFYSSAVVMRQAETHHSLASALTGKRLAFNIADSMSGYLAVERDLRDEGADFGILSGLLETGGHRGSIRAVADGRADVSAIDCKTWALARRYEPAASGLQVVWWTGRKPGLPFVTANRGPKAVL